ncbi:hypothetical protein [Xanthocytophaga agilis]|uniref:Outer membrane protein beta-barrel domain-containing protein n=1 Tax=Xanthocytophaga agilis TaxID=3048010 RepID=A0AAE3UEE2_9BACT|nr:hypothetical protein [Xanthocytophaga agilis]MDJ1500147.1 hypothetical protein [Xanthocytophaga agilis]
MSVMTPEEFDRIVKNKIEEITSVPDLDYTEDAIWQRVYSKIRAGSLGFTIVWIGILCVILGWLITKWQQNDTTTVSHTQTKYLTIVDSAMTSLKDSSVQIPVEKQATLNSGKQTAILAGYGKIEQVKGGAPEKLEVNATKLEKMAVQADDSTQKNSSDAQLKEPQSDSYTMSEVLHDLVKDHTKESSHVIQSETIHENFIRMSSARVTTGSRWIKPLSQKLSVGYGLGVGQAIYLPETTLKMPTLEIPVELRYYLTPREKRFTFFVYAMLNGSFTENTSDLSIIAGAKAQYRLWQNSRSAAFLFADIPMYRRHLFFKGNPYQQPLR